MPSIVVKLRFHNAVAAAAAHLLSRRCESEVTTDCPDSSQQNTSSAPSSIPNSNTTPRAPVLDSNLFGREPPTRKRSLPVTTGSDPSGTTPQDSSAPAKKRKLSHVADSPPPLHATRLRSRHPGGTASTNAASTSVRGLGLFAGPPTPPSEGSESQPPVFLPRPASHVDSHGHVRPLRDMFWDQQYLDAMLEELEDVLAQKRNSVHKRSAGRIRDLLSLATYPNDGDAKFLSKDEALAALAPGQFFNGPIFTAEQQPLALSTVPEFLGEYYDDTATVHIQDSSASTGKTATWARAVTMKQVKDRFEENKTPDHCPWNMLELATHHEDGLRPVFLNNEDCRLITKLKIPNHADETRRKKYEAGFKEVEKWALLAEAGALTEPHQDSHGYSTYITINQGCVGFGWLSHPTREERVAWGRDPQHFRDGRWRYVILKPGQTVFFPAGTVHMVFRLKAAGDSLAFGGHVLRCSNIVHWVTTILEEHGNPNIVNEDLGDPAVGYLERVEKFVNQASKKGTEHKWGGKDNIKEFKRLKEQFMSLPKPRVAPPSKKPPKTAALGR